MEFAFMKNLKMAEIFLWTLIALVLVLCGIWLTPIGRPLKTQLASITGNNAFLIEAANHTVDIEDEVDLRFLAVYQEVKKIETDLRRILAENPNPKNFLRAAKLQHFQGDTEDAIETLNKAVDLIETGRFEGDFSQPSKAEIKAMIQRWKTPEY